MSASRSAWRAAALLATVTLTMSLAGIAPPGARAQDELSISASIMGDWISGSGFGTAVSVTIVETASPDVTGTYDGDAIQYADDGSAFDLFLGDQEPSWDVEAGDTITVTGTGGTKEMVVADLRIAGYDLPLNTIWGTSNGSGPVWIQVEHPAGGSAELTAELTGIDWKVDLDDAATPFDLRAFDGISAVQAHTTGDLTRTDLEIPGPPRFAFEREYQEVVGADWPADAGVTLTIARDGVPQYTATRVAGRDEMPETFMGGNVYFSFREGTFHALPGDVMTMTDGTTTKRQVIPDLVVDRAVEGTGTVTGSTTLPELRSVLVVGDEEISPRDDGTWSADRGEDPVVAVQTDDDSDSTVVGEPNPQAAVDPVSDSVWAVDFKKGNVTLGVVRGGTSVCTSLTPVTTQNVLFGWNPRLIDDMWAQPKANLDRPTMALFDLGGMCDIQAGDVLSVSDGESTREITVDLITVDTANPLTDIVAGRANTSVTFKLGDGTGGYWGYPVDYPAAGTWSVWLDPLAFYNPPEGLAAGAHGWVLGDNSDFKTMVRWQAGTDAVFSGFFQPVDNRPTLNVVRAGDAIPVRFALGGDYGLDIFAAGYPKSQKMPPRIGRRDVVEETVKAKASSLTYLVRTGRYVYTWKTDKAWAGTFRQLVLQLRDGTVHKADFVFVK